MKFAVLVVVATVLCGLHGQRGRLPGAKQRPLLVAMALCRTTACVKANYAKIHQPGMVARVVFFSRLMVLQPGDRNAALGLLRNIPRTGQQDADLIVLATMMYPGEMVTQIRAVGQAYWNFSRNLAQALRLHPEFLPAFIRYGTIALSPHSTYPNWAARVCRSNPSHFLEAFETLSPKDRHYIAKHIIKPKGCKQIAFPEAE